jgi:peptide deformylase
MILKIRAAGEPVLRERARPLQPEEILLPSTQDLIASMRETMHDAPGVGLAAPQIGLPLQLAVIEDREEYMKDFSREMLAERERKPVAFEVIINPVLTLETEPEVVRASGWHARILQHEIDHLSGALYVDRMRSVSLCTLENFTRHWKAKSIAEVKRLLLS